MNETEKRRRQLLEETRRKYGDTRTPPAVHPRYGAIYSDLYEGKQAQNDGLFMRTIIAVGRRWLQWTASELCGKYRRKWAIKVEVCGSGLYNI